MMTSDKPTNNLGLPRWLKRRLVAISFAGRDHRHDPGPVDQKIVQPVVNVVEALT